MAFKVRVPLFDANITEGVLSSWRRNVGQDVRRGESLVDLVTDKANFEIESPVTGTLLAVIAEEKSAVPVGYVIAVIGEATEAVPDVSDENRATLAKHLKASAIVQVSPAPRAVNVARPAVGRVRATPKARKLARKLGVNLAEILKITGTARVTEKDVKKYANP